MGTLGQLEDPALSTVARAVQHGPDKPGRMVVVQSGAILRGEGLAAQGAQVALCLGHLGTDSRNLPFGDTHVHRHSPRTT